jgi:YD repeat-containing protein
VLTKHYYDALGRDVWAAEQDGSSLQWCYNGLPSAIAPANVRCSNQLGSVAGTTRPGTWVDSTDERGNAWQRTSDVFGNITEVMEPNGTGTTPTMETDYTYDTLSNLAAVTQYGGPSGSTGTRARSFSYDSLSRLLLANNPETGGVSYTYDLDSNLISKTDARGVATLFTYDTLNRLSRKTYSSDPSGTPISCYQYDSSSIAYGKGRLSKAWTQSASTPSPCSSGSPFLTERSILAYDPMGRVTQERQYTMASQAAGAPYSPVYSYDLAGDLISSTSGIGPTPTSSPITLGYAINAAGRLQTVTSNLSTNTIGGTAYTYPTTLFAPVSTGQSSLCTGSTSPTPQYAAFGGLMNAAFGNGLTLNRMFDLRLRTTCELDMGSTGNATGASTTVTITGAEKTN